MGTRAGIAARVSQDQGGRGQSVAGQLHGCRQACHQNEWNITDEFIDNDRSASRFARKARHEWDRLVQAVSDGLLGTVVMWEPSRGSRDLPGWSVFLDLCRRKNTLIHIVSHGRTYDMDNERDWRSLAEDGVDSAYESEKISRRVRRGLDGQAREGRPHGKVPYGYVRVYARDKTLMWEPHEPEASITRKILTEIAASQPISILVKELNGRKIQSPQGVLWTPATVRGIVRNEAYAGLRGWHGEMLPGNWPELVDAQTWYAANAVLDARVRGKRREGRAKYLVSYIALCGVCGGPISVLGRAYRCKAGHVGIQQADLDQHVAWRLRAQLTRKGTLAKLAKGPDTGEARARLAELKKRHDEIARLLASGDMPPSIAAAAAKEIVPKMEAAERAVAAAGMPAALRGYRPSQEAFNWWKGLTIHQRRDVVRALTARIELHPAVAVPVAGLDRATAKARQTDARVKIKWRAA